MSAVVTRLPEIVTKYSKQIELEQTISALVRKNLGIKETDLWLMVMSAMFDGNDRPPLAIVANTVDRMVRYGKLIAIDYSIAGYRNMFILPAETQPKIIMPINIATSSSVSTLYPVN